jgi:hypothetical protein
VERMDSADPPVDVNCLYGNGHHQHHRARARRWDASSAVDHLLATAAACVAHVYRSLYVRVAISTQVAQREETLKKSAASQNPPSSKLISARTADLADWRGETLRRIRALIKDADPDIVEQLKWVCNSTSISIRASFEKTR